MKLEDIRNYILEKNYKIIIYKDKMDIVNYKRVIDIDSNKIDIQLIDRKLSILGNNLTIQKLLNDEILIKGTILEVKIGLE